MGRLTPGPGAGAGVGALGWLCCVGLALCALYGCERAAVPRATASAVTKIVDGSIERERDAVVFVNDATGRCTGALIGRRVVLTAKHCVQEPGESEPSDPAEISIGVGSNARNSSMEFFRVVDVLVAEGIYTETPEEGVRDLLPDDVALLTLQQAPAVEPLEVSYEDPRSLVGQPVTAVGFGQTPSNLRGGVKMTVETTVEYVDDKAIFVGGTICSGDSGGPLITEAGQVVGVVSTGVGDVCGLGLGFYNRIDLHQDLVMQALVRAGEVPGECVEMGAEVCDGFDNDCNGEVDEGCLALGSECEGDAECIGGQCDETPMGRLCTASCDPLNPALACPHGLVCVNTGECEGFCVPGSAGGKEYGEACSADAECLSLLCQDPGDGQERCLSPCKAGSDSCLANEACVAEQGQCGPCAWASLVGGALGFGEPCEENEDCHSGSCVEDGSLSYCSEDCDSHADCAETAHCRDGECVRGERSPLGGYCSAHSDCGPGLFCSDPEAGGFCTRQCADVEDCGDGFGCNEVKNGRACVPTRGVQGASCREAGDCISLFCDEETGTCSRTCAQNSACGAGFECVRRGDGTEGVCLAGDVEPLDDDGGGCQAAGGAGYGAGWWLLALALRRRRRS